MASWRCRKSCHCHQQFQNMDNNTLQKLCKWNNSNTVSMHLWIGHYIHIYTDTHEQMHTHKEPTHDARMWPHIDSGESDADFSSGSHECNWSLKLVSELVMKWCLKGCWQPESYPISLNKSQTGQFWKWQRAKLHTWVILLYDENIKNGKQLFIKGS